MKIIMIKNLSKDDFYCIASNDYDFDIFIEEIKTKINAVEGSFAYNYSLKIFSQMFRYADDLRKNYNEYYKSEYDNFEIYLYQKEVLSKDILLKLYIDENYTVLKLNPDLNSYNASTLFECEDNNMELINKLLEDIY